MNKEKNKAVYTVYVAPIGRRAKALYSGFQVCGRMFGWFSGLMATFGLGTTTAH